jgi:hypothetical protein
MSWLPEFVKIRQRLQQEPEKTITPSFAIRLAELYGSFGDYAKLDRPSRFSKRGFRVLCRYNPNVARDDYNSISCLRRNNATNSAMRTP